MKKNIILTNFCGLELISSKAINNNGVVIIISTPMLFDKYKKNSSIINEEILKINSKTTIDDIKNKRVLFISSYVLDNCISILKEILDKNILVDYIFDTIPHCNIKKFTLFFNFIKQLKLKNKSNIYLNIDNSPSILFLIRKNLFFFNFSFSFNTFNSYQIDFKFRKNRNWLNLIKTSFLNNLYYNSSYSFFNFNFNLAIDNIFTIINNPINNNMYIYLIKLLKYKNFSFEQLYDLIINKNLTNHIYYYLEKFYKNNFDDKNKIGKYIFNQLYSLDYKSFPVIFNDLNDIINKNKNLTSNEYIILFSSYFNKLNNFSIDVFIKKFNDLSLNFNIIDNKIIVKIDDYNKYKLISPSTWCTNSQESFFDMYSTNKGTFFILFDFNINYLSPDSVIGFNYSFDTKTINCAFDKLNKVVNLKKINHYIQYL